MCPCICVRTFMSVGVSYACHRVHVEVREANTQSWLPPCLRLALSVHQDIHQTSWPVNIWGFFCLHLPLRFMFCALRVLGIRTLILLEALCELYALSQFFCL